MILSILYFFTKEELFILLYVTSICENLADCLASEIGVLSKNNPFDIIKFKEVENIAKQENAETLVLSCKIEEELTSLDPEEREMFKEELGIKTSGLEKLVTAGYDLLGLMSFLTAGEKEVRAWTIKKGTKAPQAAGKIHTDFERGFIKAEVVSYDDLIEAGSYVKAKEKGKVRLEGKEYIFQDGDIVVFKFNV